MFKLNMKAVAVAKDYFEMLSWNNKSGWALKKCPQYRWYIVPSSYFTTLEVDPLAPEKIFLLNIVSTNVSIFWFRVGITGILIRLYLQKSWNYIATSLNSIMVLEAVPNSGILKCVLGGSNDNLPGRSRDLCKRCFFNSPLDLFWLSSRDKISIGFR